MTIMKENMESSENLVGAKKSESVTWRLCFSSFVAVIGMFQFGWNTGVINTPQGIIKQFINDTLTRRGNGPTDATLKILIAVVVAMFAVGGLVGALMAGWLADKFGRRNGMLINNIVMAVAGVLMLTGRYAWSFEMIIIGRLLSGLGSGIYTGLVPLYLNEITPVQVMGIFGLLSQFGVVNGLFLSEVLGLSIVMGNNQYWNILLGLIIIPAIVQACLLKFCPCSPRYLLFFKKDEEAAEKALKMLRPSSYDIPAEIEQMKTDFESNKDVEKINLCGIFRDRSLLLALAVGVVLHLSQQLSGINNIFYYSATLFESVGVSKENSEYSTLGVGGIMIVMTLVSFPFVERCGRRILHLGGLSGCFIASVCFTVFYSLHSTASYYNYLSVISALLFVAAFGFGPGSIPWMMIPEMFPLSSRSTAVSVGVSVNWLSNLVVGLIFPSLLDALKNLIFIPFIVCQVLSLIFLIWKMPETKAKSNEEQALFGKSPLESTAM